MAEGWDLMISIPRAYADAYVTKVTWKNGAAETGIQERD
jgi:hypothetical protein